MLTLDEQDVLIFLAGIKKAVFFNKDRAETIELKAKGFPYLLLSTSDCVNYLFFQTKEELIRFAEQHDLSTETVNEPERITYFRMIGEALGYPPIAVVSFPIPTHDRVFIDYHGFGFACAAKDIGECLNYLRNEYPIPDSLLWGVQLRWRENGTEIVKK